MNREINVTNATEKASEVKDSAKDNVNETENVFEGFVINPTYREIEIDGLRQPIIHLWGRLKDGRSFLIKKKFHPYFFVPKEKKDEISSAIGNLPKVKIEETPLKSMSGESLVKITVKSPRDIPKYREMLEAVEIKCLEADIRFAYRAMMDWGIKSILKIKGKPLPGKLEEGLQVDVLFNEPELGPVDEYMPSVSTLSFDIESNKHTGEIYCISCYQENHDGTIKKKAIIHSSTPVNDAVVCDSEGRMLIEFSKTILEWDPDIITGWNVIDFDFNQIDIRAKKLGVRFGIGRDGSEPRLRIQTNFFRDSTANVTGRVVIDGIAALKGAFIKLRNYKLATAAVKYTDEKKIIETEGKKKYEEINRLFKENKEELIRYNMKDAQLVIQILENSGILKLTIKRSLLTGMPPDRVNASIAGLDSLYLRELHDRGFVAPSAGGRNNRDDGIGGFVMKSKPGIYRYVIVCDFKSLYPSIMITFNIDPLTYSEEGEGLINAPNGAKFKREIGIIPGIIKKFWAAREEARKAGDELARFAIKIHMNSIYGVLASPNCRFFNRQIGNAITSFAQHFIKLAASEVRKKGYDVIYGDTDSFFVDLEVDSLDKAEKIGTEIAKETNRMLEETIKKEYDVENFMEMEFEKTYASFIMPRVRGGETGAKKRYAGLILDHDGNEKITFTGLESVRRDWTDASKEFQHTIYNKIFHGEEVQGYIKKFIQEVKEGKHDSKLVYRKALRKGVEEYTKTTPPHVKAARLLDSIESSIIEYYMTTSGPEPLQKLTHKLDYDHYIDKQLKPIADSVLDLFGTSYEDLMEGSSQKNLFDY